MRTFGLSLVAGAAMLVGTAAHAQTFTYEVTWSPVEAVGGMQGESGRQFGGGVVEGTFTAAYADGTTRTGNLKCVGMDQANSGLFAIHMTCDGAGDGAKSTLLFGCNFLGKRGPETPLGCVGGIQGHSGAVEGRRGAVTMEWHSPTKSRGTGQWYAPGG